MKLKFIILLLYLFNNINAQLNLNKISEDYSLFYKNFNTNININNFFKLIKNEKLNKILKSNKNIELYNLNMFYQDTNNNILKFNSEEINKIEDFGFININFLKKIEDYLLKKTYNINLKDTKQFYKNFDKDIDYNLYLLGVKKINYNLKSYYFIIKNNNQYYIIKEKNNKYFNNKKNEIRVNSILLLTINTFNNRITSSFLNQYINEIDFKHNFNNSRIDYFNISNELYIYYNKNNLYKIKQNIVEVDFDNIRPLAEHENISKDLLMKFKLEKNTGFVKNFKFYSKNLKKYDINNYIFNKDKSNYKYHFLDNLNLNDSLFK